jgi:hypothetical protein
MAGKTLVIDDLLDIDDLGTHIATQYQTWETLRNERLDQIKEQTQYVFATDTTHTTNSKLPWSNKTTIPKLCQIRDNLHANYMASMFPKRKWLIWEGSEEADEDPEKIRAIESYMDWAIDRNEFYAEATKLIYDFIDYGNVFVTVEWVDRRVTRDTGDQMGFVGPMIRRISPLDIVFNPIAPSFEESPKIVRSLVNLGEVKEMLEQQSNEEGEREAAEELWQYLRSIRENVSNHQGLTKTKDEVYRIPGFTSYDQYLESQTAEILTFYGDIYDIESDTYLKNYVVKVIDRHKIISKEPAPSFFGTAPIYHAGWRIRPDNLWAMGPLENLIGMQYRIDHLENMKADVFDLIAYPPLRIRGYVEDFEWGPMERIYVGDGGDVEMMAPDTNVLQADNQVFILEAKMEEMAGAPKEAMGFRTPGEKTKFEIQRLENAASRVFQNKIAQFERQVVERAVNAMLEMARRNLNAQTIRVFDDENKIAVFETITANDIAGNGRIKPIAARHFAETSQMIQDLGSFFGSAAGMDPEVKQHFSSVKLARMFEGLLDLESFGIVEPYIRTTERADAQRLEQTGTEQALIEGETPSGIFEDDTDEPFTQG